MLKKTIEYEDFNGQKKTEDFYFNLTQSEVSKLELSTKGGLVEKINRISAELDGEAIMNLFEEIILKSYGQKTTDGLFMKSHESSQRFLGSMAYDKLFMELVTDPQAGAAFVQGIIPQQK